MPTAIRPRCSVLFVPGSNARALERAKTLPADALIFDPEDAVVPEARAKACQTVRDAVRAQGYGKREVVVRVNAPATAWGGADLAAVATCSAAAVPPPKVESGAMTHQALSHLRAHEASSCFPSAPKMGAPADVPCAPTC
jgi:citrate lyase subunit beta / citryl-CoA lyase